MDLSTDDRDGNAQPANQTRPRLTPLLTGGRPGLFLFIGAIAGVALGFSVGAAFSGRYFDALIAPIMGVFSVAVGVYVVAPRAKRLVVESETVRSLQAAPDRILSVVRKDLLAVRDQMEADIAARLTEFRASLPPPPDVGKTLQAWLESEEEDVVRLKIKLVNEAFAAVSWLAENQPEYVQSVMTAFFTRLEKSLQGSLGGTIKSLEERYGAAPMQGVAGDADMDKQIDKMLGPDNMIGQGIKIVTMLQRKKGLTAGSGGEISYAGR